MSGQISHAAANHQPATAASAPPRPARRGVRPRSKSSRFKTALASAAALILTAGALGAGSGPAAAVQPGTAGPTQSYIVVLQDSVTDAGATAAAHQGTFGFAAARVYRDAVNGYSAEMTQAQAAQVAADPGVDFVAAGRTFQEPQDPISDTTQVAPFWWLRVGGAPADLRTGGGINGSSGAAGDGDAGPHDVDVNVAVIDTGIDGTHPDLNVRGGVDCSSGSPVPVTPVDPHGHGTSVAGVIGAKNNGLGIVGTAPGTPLWSVRVMDDTGLITEDSLICAIDWVTSTHKDEDKGNDIEVVNISIGGQGADTAECGKGTDPMHYAICRSVRKGVTYVVAAGNSGIDFAGTVPATYDEVLTATAMADFDGRPGGFGATTCGADDWAAAGQRDDGPAVFSNFATTSRDKAHAVAGPGVCMLSTAPGGYTVTNGTSFASPAVAGSVALCISRKACGGSGDDVMEDFLKLTRDYNKENNDYGFDGDPNHPSDSGQYFGYLTQIAHF